MRLGRYLVLVICLVFLYSNSYAMEPKIIIPADAQIKAETALAKLGKGRGALLITYKELDIIGVETGLKIDVIKYQQDLKDLKAKISDTTIEIALSGDVLFDFNRWNIRKEAEEKLKKVIEVIKVNKSVNVQIVGHTDSKGSESYNITLSLKRAEAVKKWIIDNSSLTSSSFKTIGYGEGKPIAPNKNPDGSDNSQGRQKNRRVEFLIEKKVN